MSTVGIAFLCLNLSYPAPASPSRNHPAGLSPSSLVQKQSDFALKDRDRVVFYGDSITEQRLYTTYIEHYVLTHYPDRRITFINTGWGGDKVSGNDCKPCAGVGGLARIKRDVIDHRPTVVTLLSGMNDGQYRDFDPAISKVYEDGLTAIIRELKSKTGARIYVMTPTVYDGSRHTIDGKDAGEYTSEALSGGVPVSLLSGKATDETRALTGLVRKRAELFFLRWRQFEAALATEYQSATRVVSSLDLLIDEIQERTRTLGAFHKYELVVSRT
jgi:hypothetical protein